MSAHFYVNLERSPLDVVGRLTLERQVAVFRCVLRRPNRSGGDRERGRQPRDHAETLDQDSNPTSLRRFAAFVFFPILVVNARGQDRSEHDSMSITLQEPPAM